MNAAVSSFHANFRGWRLIFPMLASFIGFMAGWSALYLVFETNLFTQSVKTTEMREYTGLGDVDTMANFIYSYDRKRECTAAQIRYFWRYLTKPDGSPVIYNGEKLPQIVPIPYFGDLSIGGKGVGSFVLSFPIPQGMEDGDWFYTARRRETCGWVEWIRGGIPRETGAVALHLQLLNGHWNVTPRKLPPGDTVPPDPLTNPPHPG